MDVVHDVVHQLGRMEVGQVPSNCLDFVAVFPLLVDLLDRIDRSMELVLSPEELNELLALVGRAELFEVRVRAVNRPSVCLNFKRLDVELEIEAFELGLRILYRLLKLHPEMVQWLEHRLRPHWRPK